jgi:hypothetical protein
MKREKFLTASDAGNGRIEFLPTGNERQSRQIPGRPMQEIENPTVTGRG